MNQSKLSDREAVKVFWEVKRKILAEFGVKLRLNQADIKEQISLYNDKTSDDELIGLMSKLLQHMEVDSNMMSQKTEPESPKKVAPVRMYRGRPVVS